MIKNGDMELVWSEVLEYENNDNPFDIRREKIAEWEDLAGGCKMLTDTALKRKGMDTLTKTLGLVEAERFITLILREPEVAKATFDYTEWQRDLYEGVSLDEFYANIKQFRATKKEPL
jgi:hypothetical protein